MIVPISRERFERFYRPEIPNPDIVFQHRFENTEDKTLGFVAFHQKRESWMAVILKKRRGHYKNWRQAVALATEQEALNALLQLFGLTDRGYQETLAERALFGSPKEKVEFLALSEWKFDPGYDEATRARLDGPLTELVQAYFARAYPALQDNLRCHPTQKSALSLKRFPTDLSVSGEPVWVMAALIVEPNSEPQEFRIYVGRAEFIATEQTRIFQFWKELSRKPGVEMQITEGQF
jgi:hypothetical protein